MEIGMPNDLNEYPIHLTLALNLTGIRLEIGDYLNIMLTSCWKDNDESTRGITPTVKLIGNASFSFSDDLDMQNRDFHYAMTIQYFKKGQMHQINVPVQKYPPVWNFTITANLLNDFSTMLDPNPKIASFCEVGVDLDKGRVFEHPDLLFPMILKEFGSFYEEQTEDYVVNFNLDRELQKNDRIFIWILTPLFGPLNLSPLNRTLYSEAFDPESLVRKTNLFSSTLNGTISESRGELIVYMNNFRSFYFDFLEGRNDDIVLNAKVYLLSSSVTNSTESRKLWLVLGVCFGLLTTLSSLLLIIQRNRKQKEEIRYSHASTILGDDESYTLHSESTISTVPSFLSK
jgi:hypothetical protein